MRLILVFLFSLCFASDAFAQQIKLSPEASVSIITVGPGQSLNDAFGHNAFRILDKERGIDIVYGYGEYDFDTPNFYLKFAQGRLNYLISRHNFRDFYNYYVRNKRSITEQELNFTKKEKQRLFSYLEENYKPENRKYLYDFFFDNCATRIRDIVKTTSLSEINFTEPENFENKTFRALIHDHVGLNTWGSFGIDIALGSVIDKEASLTEHMFLPEYINLFMGQAKIDNKRNLVVNSNTLYTGDTNSISTRFFTSPLFVMSLIGLIILYFTYRDYKNRRRSKWLDICLFSLTGIIGILILLLWFATDHTATAHNYNLLWAFPLNLILVQPLFYKTVNKWVKSFIKFLIIMLCLMTLHWLIGVQVFAIGLIPFLIALLVRYLYLLKTLN
ncbi:MAG: DUF4105 domain-containing protein [Winogradskyella sp.]|uniref:lipoprotein N-acyltransferase Lnb domain-containing protein n=1 Tax=Winogradskyella sp. TaxID=1883156 RepID=UPI00180405B7|nr:DUF4105 domain-containing protein [Winogradskyella sp.]